MDLDGACAHIESIADVTHDIGPNDRIRRLENIRTWDLGLARQVTERRDLCGNIGANPLSERPPVHYRRHGATR